VEVQQSKPNQQILLEGKNPQLRLRQTDDFKELEELVQRLKNEYSDGRLM
jgi:hypothetical protein